MNKYFYPIYKMKLKPWIKYWLLKKTSDSKVLSDLIEGTSPITIEGVYKGTSLQELVFKGQTTQTGTPTPEAPVPVNVVKGNNTITINDTGYLVNLNGSIATEYSPYTANPIELCKIGDYQDYIYKSNGTWYLHKEIGKVVLNGSENWGGSPNYYTSILQNLIAPTPATERIIALSNNFLVQGYNYKSSNNLYFHPNKNLQIENPNASYYATVNDWKTWLSNNNTTVYYVLATPTTTEITDTTLILQLEAIKNASLISGTNEITQIPDDLPFILNFKYYMKG